MFVGLCIEVEGQYMAAILELLPAGGGGHGLGCTGRAANMWFPIGDQMVT